MIKPDETSMYSFVDDNHTAPVIEPEKGIQISEKKAPLVREAGWQSANNERFKQDLPDHVRDAMTVTQGDHSYYAFTRFAFGHPARDGFEKVVNKAYKDKVGELKKGFVFIDERNKYIKFYRSMMQ